MSYVKYDCETMEVCLVTPINVWAKLTLLHLKKRQAEEFTVNFQLQQSAVQEFEYVMWFEKENLS